MKIYILFFVVAFFGGEPRLLCLPLPEIALSESWTFKAISCVYLANTENKQVQEIPLRIWSALISICALK